jgi:predicted PurR-regulated permease PerM
VNRRYFLLGLFLFVLYWVWYLYRPFWMPIFIASLLALATSNLNLLLDRYFKYKLSKAIVLTLILGLLFFAPVVYALNTLTVIMQHFDASIIDKMVNVKNHFHIPDFLGAVKPQIQTFLDSINAQEITKTVVKYMTVVIKNSAGFLKDMVMIVVFYFFANYYGKELVRFLKGILPFDEHSAFYQEISSVMNIVFYSTLVTALFEGALFAIIAAIYGYDALLFGILYGFASLIPIVGGALMWVPLSIYQFSTGDTTGAWVIAIYSIVVISVIADTFIKPVIISEINNLMTENTSRINPLIIFFSILAGLTTFGFWGVIIGPAITTFFVSLVRIYQVVLDEEKYLSR